MQTLHITTKKKWFDMIASGEKKEEYRELTPYWISRLMHPYYFGKPTIDEFQRIRSLEYETTSGKTAFDALVKHFDIVSNTNGYGHHRPNIKWKHLGITIGTGKPEWGAEPGKNYFILKIGEVIK